MRDFVVIVTGADRGIGREIAHAFAKLGASVVLAARSVESLELVRGELARIGAQAVAVQTDVTVDSDVQNMVATALELRGRIDVLVNNAGIAGPTVPIADLGPEDWHRVLDSNLTSCYLCCHAVVPHMIRQRFGRIINISSISGKRPLPFRAAYCAAKIGIIGLTRTLASELGPYNITVNAICPGSVAGERIEQVIAGQAKARNLPIEQVTEEFLASSPLRRLVAPKDVASMATYLAGATGDAITGEDVNVTAGVVMY